MCQICCAEWSCRSRSWYQQTKSHSSMIGSRDDHWWYFPWQQFSIKINLEICVMISAYFINILYLLHYDTIQRGTLLFLGMFHGNQFDGKMMRQHWRWRYRQEKLLKISLCQDWQWLFDCPDYLPPSSSYLKPLYLQAIWIYKKCEHRYVSSGFGSCPKMVKECVPKIFMQISKCKLPLRTLECPCDHTK